MPGSVETFLALIDRAIERLEAAVRAIDYGWSETQIMERIREATALIDRAIGEYHRG